jgi:hypothetical protein
LRLGTLNQNKISTLYEWSAEKIKEIQAGDYIFINSGPVSLGGVGGNGTDNHGFLVVGWGEIQDCTNALSQRFIFANTHSPGTIVPIVNQMPPTRTIPYVVDFPGVGSGKRQQSKPRPFYCSVANDTGVPLGSDGTAGRFTSGHGWFFVKLPNNIIIQNNVLVNDLSNWAWISTDGVLP